MVSRRRLLQGGLSLATLAAFAPRLARAATDRFLIVYWNAGGWDPAMVFDPHFDVDAIDRGSTTEAGVVGGLTFGDAPDRPEVRSFLEQWGSRTAFVNGIAVGSISHTKCTQLMLTGSRTVDAPDLPTILAASTASDRVLPHLVLSGPRFPGTLGGAMVPLSPTLTGTMTGAAPAAATYNPDVEALIQDHLSGVAQGLASASADPAYAAFETAIDRMDSLRDAAADLDVAPGATDAERLERGVTALSMGLSRCLMIQGSMPGYSSWDSHQDNEGQQTRAYDHTFARLSALMALLADTPTTSGTMLDCTTVLVMSEMGRTPFLNAGLGKDHWPYTSAMLVGAGVQGDRVVGASDDVLVGLPVDHITGTASSSGEQLGAAGLLAGLLTSFGVDPGAYFPGVTPFTAPFS